ncbi:MAG: EamA family transporter [Alphaproteobacteria bacterium]|nr:EamA family transporter [Alphaproteobacteria bacterium]
MELWIPVTIAAAFLQNARSALQKHLRSRLDTVGAAYVRFVYAVPFTLVWVATLLVVGGHPLPLPDSTFLVFAGIAGLSQILATLFLVALFSLRTFAAGTAYSKTETVQAAIIGLLILGDPLSVGALAGIVVSLVGVLVLSIARTTAGARELSGRAIPFGLASGALFALTAVSVRAASLSLGGDGFLMQAAFTLLVVTAWQTVIMTAWLFARRRQVLAEAFGSWRVSGLVGLTGMMASACWFTAMTIENAAYVRALGQVELVFTFIASRVIFREHSSIAEFMGILAIVAGILVLVLGR